MISAWARSNHPKAPDRAEAILQRMIELSKDERNKNIKPNTISFNIVIDCYSRRRNPEKAMAILQKMENFYEESDRDEIGKEVKPNVISYNTVLKAWSLSNDVDAAKNAQSLLNKMETNDENGVRPNIVSYNTVISAIVRNGTAESIVSAKNVLLQQMVKNNVMPDVVSFTTLMRGVARSNMRDKANQAQHILRSLQEFYKTGNDDIKPNILSYNTVLNACAFSGHYGISTKKEAFLIAISTYNEIRNCEYVEPDSVTYGSMLKICSNLMPKSGKSRTSLAKQIFKECCSKGLVNEFVLNALRASISQEDFSNIFNCVENSNKLNIPSDWKCNVRNNGNKF